MDDSCADSVWIMKGEQRVLGISPHSFTVPLWTENKRHMCQHTAFKRSQVTRAATYLNRWYDETCVAVEGTNELHVVVRQTKVQHLQVLLDPGGGHTFWDTHHAPLNVPPADGRAQGHSGLRDWGVTFAPLKEVAPPT